MNEQREGTGALDSTFLSPAPCGAGLCRSLLEAPGGYLWWYLDLVDDRRSGLVVIWSFGLPFLPGYARAARRGRAQLPRERPSLNVATYDRGRLDFYLLQEFRWPEVQWESTPEGDRWRFGDSTIRSVIEEGRRRVALDLCLDAPGLTAPARLKLEGGGPGVWRPGDPHERRHTGERRQAPVHDWAPLCCGCSATATLVAEQEKTAFSGRLYHDRNGGAVPLHDTGLRRWWWGRVALAGGEFIYYAYEMAAGGGDCALWRIDAGGRLRPVQKARLWRGREAKNRFGLSWWPQMTVNAEGHSWLRLEHCDVVDSGPFYLRTLCRATDGRGRVFPGVGEVCEPPRIDRGWHRPLVKMRVHRRGKDNSMWLPLFTGPKKGRVRRLISSVFGRRRRQRGEER